MVYDYEKEKKIAYNIQVSKILDSSALHQGDKLGTGCAVACESNKEFISVVA